MDKRAIQYTIRNVPAHVDQILRRRAEDTDKTFNQVLLEALAVGVGERLRKKRNLQGVVGSLSEDEAQILEDSIRRQRQIDVEPWK